MSNLNVVVLTGNIGTEIERREFESGAKIAKFSLAVNRWNKKEQKDVTDWFNVETFSKLGDYITKGMKVTVSGSLLTNVYDNKDGIKVKKVYILADKLELPNKGNTSSEDLGSNADYPDPDDDELIDDEDIPF